MLLVVKQDDAVINQYRFNEAPVYIGRHQDSNIFLPDRMVSRHHAALFTTEQGDWVLEDLDSANKTYLNGQPIYRSPIKTGDVIRIAEFTITVDLEDRIAEETAVGVEEDKALQMEDTLITGSSADTQIIVRKPDSEHAPAIRLPAKRANDFLRATEQICRTKGLDDIVRTLLYIARTQFSAFHAWCALRNHPEGPMTCHAGKRRDGQSITVTDIPLGDKINEAVEKKQFMLLPRLLAQAGPDKIKSAMIAPILGETGCFGVLYLDNAMDHEHYNMSDLDYLMLLSIHTAAIVENF